MTPEWLFSRFKWTYDNPNFGGVRGVGSFYEHEFRIEEQRYTGIVGRIERTRTWNTNLPLGLLGGLKVEDNREGQNYDEFAIKTLNPGGIRKNEYYRVWVDVEPGGEVDAGYRIEGETLVLPRTYKWKLLSSGATRASNGAAWGNWYW